jgi:hypothetical protein
MLARTTLLGALLAGCSSSEAEEAESPKSTFVVTTFNVGTPALPGIEGDYVDQWYGNGLAHTARMNEARAFFAMEQPDLVLFQEIFHPDGCTAIPAEAKVGFVCETWLPGDPSVAQSVLGVGYQVACHLDKPDKCAAVHESFGKIQGCDAALCLNGLAGAEVPGCGNGSRIGRGVIERVDGTTLTLVNVHGSSGVTQADQDCRVKQFAQVFEDLGTGDGPAANGERNVIAGDLNTDPGRHQDFDESAEYFRQHVGPDLTFQFVSDVGVDATPSYGGFFNIDHVASDAFSGSCWSAGSSAGHPTISTEPGFDHEPLVCTLSAR